MVIFTSFKEKTTRVSTGRTVVTGVALIVFKSELKRSAKKIIAVEKDCDAFDNNGKVKSGRRI